MTSARRVTLACMLGLPLACSRESPVAGPTPTAKAATPDPVKVTERPPQIQGVIGEAVSTSRPEKDRQRDADRKPREVLEFLGIDKGQRVVELMSGRGYYVDVIARVVGRTGKVWAHNSPFVLKRYAEGPITERLKNPILSHVERLDTELDDPKLPANIDAVVIIIFYHDTYWQGVDRAKMNAAVFAALKPGGVYGVVDHHAEVGSGARDVKSLHRVDAELVKKEILAAGFELEAESDLLRHPEDERTINVFKPEIRGKSDRFVFKFRKPD